MAVTLERMRKDEEQSQAFLRVDLAPSEEGSLASE